MFWLWRLFVYGVDSSCKTGRRISFCFSLVIFWTNFSNLFCPPPPPSFLRSEKTSANVAARQSNNMHQMEGLQALDKRPWQQEWKMGTGQNSKRHDLVKSAALHCRVRGEGGLRVVSSMSCKVLCLPLCTAFAAMHLLEDFWFWKCLWYWKCKSKCMSALLGESHICMNLSVEEVRQKVIKERHLQTWQNGKPCWDQKWMGWFTFTGVIHLQK